MFKMLKEGDEVEVVDYWTGSKTSGRAIFLGYISNKLPPRIVHVELIGANDFGLGYEYQSWLISHTFHYVLLDDYK